METVCMVAGGLFVAFSSESPVCPLLHTPQAWLHRARRTRGPAGLQAAQRLLITWAAAPWPPRMQRQAGLQGSSWCPSAPH